MATFGGAEKEMQNIGAAAVAQPEDIRARRTAAESTLGSLNADLGAAGTYDLPSTATITPNPVATITANQSQTSPPVQGGMLNRDGYNFVNKSSVKKYDKLIKKGMTPDEARAALGTDKSVAADSIFDRQVTGTGAVGGGGKTGVGQTSLVLDKDKAKAQIESGSMFRQTSRMVAESEQLLSRQGPLFDEMMQSTQLPIIEGAAAAARDNTESLRQMMAAGGSQRRTAFDSIAKIRAQDNINMQKGQQLAQAHLQMDQWIRDNAKNVINFAQNFTQNQAGIRESYQSAMDAAAALMDNSALPLRLTTALKAQEFREAASAQQRGKVNRWITGVLGLAEGVMTAYRGGDASASNAQFSAISGTPEQSGIPSSMVNQTAYPAGNNPAAAQNGTGGRTLMGDVQNAGKSISDSASAVGSYFGIGGGQ